MSQEPETSVVEWGEARDPFAVHLSPAQRRRYLSYPLAVAGAAAAFLSLMLDWQTLRVAGSDFGFLTPDEREASFGIIGIFGWGAGWVVGALVLSGCAALALRGDAAMRRHARLIGLAVAGVLLGFLVAAAVGLSQSSFFSELGSPVEYEHTLGAGVWLAAGSVLLLGSALWSAAELSGDGPAAATAPPGSADGQRPGLPRQADSPSGGPIDISVAPAEPFSDDVSR